MTKIAILSAHIRQLENENDGLKASVDVMQFYYEKLWNAHQQLLNDVRSAATELEASAAPFDSACVRLRKSVRS